MSPERAAEVEAIASHIRQAFRVPLERARVLAEGVIDSDPGRDPVTGRAKEVSR